MELKRKETIGWIDLLRVIACFLVVFAHCCDPFVARFDTDRSTFLQGCAAGSAVRSCVTSVRHDDRSFAFSPPQQHERVLPETHRAHCATPHFLVGHATGAVLRIPELYCHH